MVPVSFCIEQSCSKFAEPHSIRCKEHKTEATKLWDDTRRDQTAKKFYAGSGWKKFRLTRLNKHPVCMWSEEPCTQVATDVDHIIPMDQGGAALSDDNTQCLCKSHHAVKTRRENQRPSQG